MASKSHQDRDMAEELDKQRQGILVRVDAEVQRVSEYLEERRQRRNEL